MEVAVGTRVSVGLTFGVVKVWVGRGVSVTVGLIFGVRVGVGDGLLVRVIVGVGVRSAANLDWASRRMSEVVTPAGIVRSSVQSR